jgi:hypothetical protein
MLEYLSFECEDYLLEESLEEYYERREKMLVL